MNYAQGYAYCNPRRLHPRRWPLNRRGTAALCAVLLALAALTLTWRL